MIGPRASGGYALRRDVLRLAKAYHTPVNAWLDMPLTELNQWVGANNRLLKERQQ